MEKSLPMIEMTGKKAANLHIIPLALDVPNQVIIQQTDPRFYTLNIYFTSVFFVAIIMLLIR